MTTKRNHGSGTLISRGTNKWLIKIDHPRNPVTQQRVRRSETFDGKKGAAQKRMTELLRERDHGTAVAPSKVTVGEWLNGWLVRRNAEGHLSGKTHERYSGIIHKHLIPRLGNVRLQALRADHVNDLKASWLSGHQSTSTAPLSGSTAHKHLVVLRQALADALTAGLITRNPMDSVTAPSPKVRTERRALTTGDITELLRAATGTRFEAPIRFTLATGLREGELLALHWSDVDFDRATANVHRTLHYVGGEVRFAQPKTKRSERTLELSATTVQRLRSHRAMQAELRLKVGPLWQECGLVFPSLIGTPWLPRAFYRDYRAVLAKTNIVNIEGVNWHTLRHTAATQWIAHDVDIFSVSRRLGHASAAFTMDVYGHLLKGQQRHASEALDHLLA